MVRWLLKSEPQVFSIDDLAQQQTVLWDGVRNYQARNYLQQMQPGDQAWFYHSSTTPPALVGVCEVVETCIPDPTQFDMASPYYDPKSSADAPRWWTVRVRFVHKLPKSISLSDLRSRLPEDFVLFRRSRLSVLPIPLHIAQMLEK
jgi:predicted RNA-binding protein with PUA-like domain